MAEDIITLLKNSTKTQLALLDDNSIEFGTRIFEQVFALNFNKGVFVTLGGGTVEPLTMGSSKKDVINTIEIVIYTKGYDPPTDLKLVATLLEEIEEVLWANMTLAGGGTIMDEPSVAFGPPVARSEVMLHWAVLEVRYQKTGT
jgi:hypothetical protein